MSHPQNDIYLEGMREEFSEKDGLIRSRILKKLRDDGFADSADVLESQWDAERALFLEVVGVREGEVLQDDEGEFFMETEESGAPGADYQVIEVKRYIPDYLNVAKWVIKSKKLRRK